MNEMPNLSFEPIGKTSIDSPDIPSQKQNGQSHEKPDLVGHRQRLRERFLKSGLSGLAEYETLELLLTYAILRKDVKPIAKRLVAQFKTLKGVLDADPVMLGKIEGIGPESQSFFKLIHAIMQHYFELSAAETDLLSSPASVLNYCRATVEAEKKEVFYVLYLSSKNRLISSEKVAEGTIDQAAVYPRRLIEGALRANAAALIFVHNHPSGDPTPSLEDKALTRKLVEAAKTIGITVHDHLIIGNGRHFSFREHHLI